MCSQGGCRPRTGIRLHGFLQIFHVRYAHRRNCAHPILAVATPVPVLPIEISQLTCHAQRRHTRPTYKQVQLRELVHRWIYLPYVLEFFFMEAFFFPFILLGCARLMSIWRGAEHSGRSEVWRKFGGFSSNEVQTSLVGDLHGLRKFLGGIDQTSLSRTGKGRAFLAYQSGWSPKVYHNLDVLGMPLVPCVSQQTNSVPLDRFGEW